MNEIVMSILMVAAILVVCGAYFKLVILKWLSWDSAMVLKPETNSIPKPVTTEAHKSH